MVRIQVFSLPCLTIKINSYNKTNQTH